MTDQQKQAVILMLVEKQGENPNLWGYARLRKSVLLLQKEEDVPLGFPFRLERERPVSPDLQRFLEDMRFKKLLVFKETPHGYRIFCGEKGKKLLAEHLETVEQYKEQVARVFDIVKDLRLTDLREAAYEAFLRNPE
ncbi:MAG TPA: hypothetical protein DCE03_02895 [Synergistaceae bacterium]|jgi:hypothetical protein|nr:MAG: Uncharacterized protein XD80_0199 [Synergistales bacterium 53_16]KUL02776.1 MAG: Uncharacterized protein XE12_0670 [Synergistales bacterium 54_9]MDK2845842.1 hypothetical protein [Synergistales bacterium]HAA47421.1 hypothetical protein [Synergistaceae bacterium]MDN5336498.1 hypothetical protein [Synergistales bacterium]